MKGYSANEVFPKWAPGLLRLTEWLVGLIPEELPPRIGGPCRPGTTPNGSVSTLKGPCAIPECDLDAPLPHEHNPTPSSLPRCHEIVRALYPWLKPILPQDWTMHVVDGHYGAVDHSWFAVLNPGKFNGFILDAYAVGRLPTVQIVDVYHPTLPHLRYYRDGGPRVDIRNHDISAIDAAIRPHAGAISLGSFLQESPSA